MYEIIKKKGATYYAIALVVSKLVKSIVLDQSRVFTVSSLVEGLYGVQDVCLSLPMVIRKSGTCMRLPIELDEKEQELLKASAKKIKEECRQADAYLGMRS